MILTRFLLLPVILLVATVVEAQGPPLRPRPAPRPAEDARVPAFVTDIDGQIVDVEALATDHNLVVVTLKAAWCQVCQQQLVRIRQRLPGLEACGVTFLVLAPGTPEELRAIRKRTGFEFPFIADEGLALARSLGLAMNDSEILPCMLQILPDRSIGWRQLGRNGAYFGDAELTKYFDCSRFA